MAEDTLAPVQHLLASTSLHAYLAARPPATVVTVADTDRLDAVLALLSSRGILSAPVFKAGTARCLGFVSVADVLRAVLAWAAVGTGAPPAARAEGLQRAATRLARERVRDLGKANDGALLWRKAEGGMSLLDVVRLGFLRGGGAPPVHRVAIYDVLDDEDGGGGGAWAGSGGGGGSGDAAEPSTSTPSPALAGAPVRFVAVLSQTDVVAFLAKRAAADPATTLGPLAAARVGDLNVASAPVVSVPAGMPAAHAFAALLDRGGQVSAAAVVAQTEGDDGRAPGAVVADCSSRSLRGLSSDRVTALARPILDFLRAPAAPASNADGAAAAEWGVIGADAAPLPLSEVAPARVAPGASFGELLTLLAGGGARRHRAYVVDGDGRPQGIISLTDVLRLIARE